MNGRENYSKLLPWQQHCTMLRAIVQAGVPVLSYGVMIGFPDDDHESLLRLEEAIAELYEQLHIINPSLIFYVTCVSIAPLPGTPQGHDFRQLGLLRFEDPTIIGGFFTSCADTHHLSYEEISDWQIRLTKVMGSNSQNNTVSAKRTWG